MYSFYYCSGSLERAFFKSCSLLWGLEAFYLLIKPSKVEHEQAIYAKHLQTPSKIKKAKLHTRWEQECKKKTFKNQKNCTPHWGLSPVWFSGHGGCRFVFFIGGVVWILAIWKQKCKKPSKKKKTAHFYHSPLQASGTPLYRYFFCDVLVAHL